MGASKKSAKGKAQSGKKIVAGKVSVRTQAKKLPAKGTQVKRAGKVVIKKTVRQVVKGQKLVKAKRVKSGLSAKDLLGSGITIRKTKRNGKDGKPDYLMV